jgi:thioredoxin reductase
VAVVGAGAAALGATIALNAAGVNDILIIEGESSMAPRWIFLFSFYFNLFYEFWNLKIFIF